MLNNVIEYEYLQEKLYLNSILINANTNIVLKKYLNNPTLHNSTLDYITRTCTLWTYIWWILNDEEYFALERMIH